MCVSVREFVSSATFHRANTLRLEACSDISSDSIACGNSQKLGMMKPCGSVLIKRLAHSSAVDVPTLQYAGYGQRPESAKLAEEPQYRPSPSLLESRQAQDGCARLLVLCHSYKAPAILPFSREAEVEYWPCVL